jgi:predicted nucleic acid-binding Zn ribbon protein
MISNEETAAVTVFVTPLESVPFAPFPDPAPCRCLRCNAVVPQDQDYCKKGCKQAVYRARKSGKLQRLVRAVLLALVGLEPAKPPKFWQLIRRLVRREAARLTAEQKARLLPGAPAPHFVAHAGGFFVFEATTPRAALDLLLQEQADRIAADQPIVICWQSRRSDGACDSGVAYRFDGDGWRVS